MEPKFMQTNVVVVGGGMASLAAADYLARAGVEVILFERAPNHPRNSGALLNKDDDGHLFARDTGDAGGGGR